MREDAVAEIREALAAMKLEEQRERARPSDFVAPNADRMRQGVAKRLEATEALASTVRPGAPTFVTLEKPFLIWALRDGRATGMLSDTHIEPRKSSARFYSSWESGNVGSGYIGPTDEVGFYFLWQNDSGSDAVVNVESQLLLAGRASVFADSGFIWSPFWGQGTIGESHLRIKARLKLLEWWNQPPTQPLAQPSQDREVIELSASGGWAVLGSGNGKSEWVSGSFHLNYDAFLIPADAATVFEVTLSIHYGGSKASNSVDVQTPPESLVCPYVQLEGLSVPLTLSG
jgi:hypothetical protein